MSIRSFELALPSLRRPLTTVAALAALLPAGSAAALEFGSVRALQHGPVGDSPQFAPMDSYAGEGALIASRSWGKYTINDDLDSKVSGSAFKMRIAAGGGMAPSKTFAITGYVDFTLASDADEEASRADPKSSIDTGPYRHELSLFALFRPGPLVVGGGLGLLVVGSEEREFYYGDDRYRQNVTSAAMPLMRLFGGVTTKQFDATLGLRLFSMGEAVVEAEVPGGEKLEYDIARRNPGEIHADGRFKIGNTAQIGASLAYVLTAQASEQVDEFSLRFADSGSSRVRRTGGARRNDDQFKLGVGGRFDPSKMVGILAALSYTAASYAKEEYASLEHENLGGIRLDIGTDVHVQAFRGFFQAGYAMDSSASYTVSDASRSATAIDQSQRPPVNEGDKVKITQGSWVLALGGGVEL